jgi:hypothetical protein
MSLDQPVVIHLVDVITREHENQLGPAPPQKVQVLVDGVRGPRYQRSRSRCCAGSTSTNSPKWPSRKLQRYFKCWIRLCAFYCVATPIRRIPELTRFDRTKSMRRNLPPKGTAGFAR